MRERFAASAVTTVLEGVTDSVEVSATLRPSDDESPGTDITLVGRTRLIKEFDREVGEVPKALPSETSVLLTVLAPDRSSMLELDTEGLVVCIMVDDDVDPVIIPLRCVSLLLKEDNRGGSDVIDTLGTGASLDPGKTLAVDRSRLGVTEVLGVEVI